MNYELSIPFEANLRSLFSENDFTSLDTTQYGEYVKGYTDEFLKIHRLDDAENRHYFESLAEEVLSFWKTQNSIPPFEPSLDQIKSIAPLAPHFAPQT
ncbi:MAG: hypothetical protein KDK97_19710 [Verrucomicrobiales bacterium]|nr:hypothetical protein [Verrucomicrobiales bacterium]